MDIFVEQIVKKTSGGKDLLLKALIGIGAGLVSAIAILFLGFTSLIIIAGVFYGAYWLMTGLDCEYEYIVTNGEIDIDKIIAKRKRKRLITVKASSFESYGVYGNSPDIGSDVTIVNVGEKNETSYYADFKHDSLGKVRLIFTPDERVRKSIETFLPRAIRISLQQN